VKVEKGKAKEKETPEVPEPHQYMAFYKYAKIKKPEKVCEDLRSRLEMLGGLGRIYVSGEGINAQMSLPRPCFDAWLFLLRSICDKHNIGPITMSVGSIASMQTEESRPFSKLTIKLKNRIVQDALPSHIDQALDLSDLSDLSVSPHDWHHKMALLHDVSASSTSSSSPASLSSHHTSSCDSHIPLESSFASHPPDQSKPILVDCRNYYESQIGIFDGAIRLKVDRFSESFDAIDELLQSEPLDREVLLYCTGGIRCEKVGAYLKQVKGRKNVGTLQGGINRYAKYVDEVNATEGKAVVETKSLQAREGDLISTHPTCDEMNSKSSAMGVKVHVSEKENVLGEFERHCSKDERAEGIEEGTEVRLSEKAGKEGYATRLVRESATLSSKLDPTLKGVLKEIEEGKKGIVSYFKGINYQFDSRNKFGLEKERVTEDVIAKCEGCGKACDHMRNCRNPMCNILVVLCDSCYTKQHGTCSSDCEAIVALPEEEIHELQRDRENQLARLLYSRSYHLSPSSNEPFTSGKHLDVPPAHGRGSSENDKSPPLSSAFPSAPSLSNLPFVRSKAFLNDILGQKSAMQYRKTVLHSFFPSLSQPQHSDSSSDTNTPNSAHETHSQGSSPL